MSKKSEEKQHITRISATPRTNTKVSEPKVEPKAEPKAEPKVEPKAEPKAEPKVEPKAEAKKAKTKKVKTKKVKTKKVKSEKDPQATKKPKLLARPFVALGHYIRDSWRELRLVRWPDRKATWKMTLAVLVYCAIMMIFILLLDTLFTFLFNIAVQK